jgi:hypothetical protein
MALIIVLLLAGLIGYAIGREDAVGRVRSWYANRRNQGAEVKEDGVSEAV